MEKEGSQIVVNIGRLVFKTLNIHLWPVLPAHDNLHSIIVHAIEHASFQRKNEIRGTIRVHDDR